MDESFRLEPQSKPEKSLNYSEKVKKGLLSGGLKRVRLNPVSDKLQKRLCKYRNLCYTDSEIQTCFMCGLTSNKDILERHHKFGRSGDNLFKYEYCCKECHAWVHSNPNKARELGYLCF